MSADVPAFEYFLASLMTVPGTPTEHALPSPEVLARLRAEEERMGFWAPPSVSYFQARLPPVGVDAAFEVAIAVRADTLRHRFALKLWPDFELGVLVEPDAIPRYPHFVRRPDAVASVPSLLRVVKPWSATLEEVRARFGAPETDDSWDLRRWLTYRAGADLWTVTFDLGLFQEVAPTGGSR